MLQHLLQATADHVQLGGASGDDAGGKTAVHIEAEPDVVHSPRVASGAETQTPGSPISDSRSSRGTTSPVRVPRGGDGGQQTEDVKKIVGEQDDQCAAEQLLEDVAPADGRRGEWIANVQKKFGADPHYHAMLKYEPQALKALITCTMAPV